MNGVNRHPEDCRCDHNPPAANRRERRGNRTRAPRREPGVWSGLGEAGGRNRKKKNL